jgi:hypothetical protein
MGGWVHPDGEREKGRRGQREGRTAVRFSPYLPFSLSPLIVIESSPEALVDVELYLSALPEADRAAFGVVAVAGGVSVMRSSAGVV